MKVKEMTYIALFAAIMGALGLVPPIMLSFTPVPITLQTLGVLLAGGLLGARLGGLSQIVFLLIVAAGMPLLSGGRGGLSVFVGPSAGYLFAYPITAYCIGYILSRIRTLSLGNILLINLTIGIFLIYLFGIPVQAFMMDISLLQAVKLSLVYIPGDVLKATLASFLVFRLLKSPVFHLQISKTSKTH
ncbi:biotin transporter BioY [Peribacillus cavernae]|uniref:Biotin transporter n=1 Tax=Peribacillus cavernae TaxID=1674310 RepID=A0A3S1B3G2_9BACI|nr:biotin transporter BioY [Peribacillus cavernae]MDQ0219412.1 biotin transport system substrate-specific component [Peribacillus cavernae]RUQ27715.1 biotin transporter BioY [Peribacillus cavernae]